MKIYIFLIFFSVIVMVRSSSYCVEDRDEVYQQEEAAPSPAPSMNLKCADQTSNARGRYTATAAPCTFYFHKANLEKEDDLIKFKTSDLCSNENSFLSVREYVMEWPDECVGDFQRCYSLEHHRSVVWDFLCDKDWKVPEGTTHVSVDCKQDKDLVATTQRREEQIMVEHNARVETFEMKFYNLALILGACVVSVFALSNLVIKPLVMLKWSSRNRHVLPRSHSCSCETCHGTCQRDQYEIDGTDESQGEMPDFDSQELDFGAVPVTPASVSSWGTSNDSYHLRQESLSHRTSELTEEESVHNQSMEDIDSQANFSAVPTVPAMYHPETLARHGSEIIQGEPQNIEPADNIPMASATYHPETIVHGNSEIIDEESRNNESLHDVDLQIPDFEAIPIVPATILST